MKPPKEGPPLEVRFEEALPLIESGEHKGTAYTQHPAQHRERLNKCRIVSGDYSTTPEDGFTGMYLVRVQHRRLKIIASDGMGWQHVSVSIPNVPHEVPTWAEMCMVKELFWGPDVTVMQLHPPAEDSVNDHPGCLHLWRPLHLAIPRPPSFMV